MAETEPETEPTDEEGIDRSQLRAHFQEITGIEDEDQISEHLASHQWNLEAAVQDALNEKEGIRPIFAPTPTIDPISPPSPPIYDSQDGALPPGDGREGERNRGAVVRRESWLAWSFNLAIFPLRFVLGAANEIFQFIINLLFGSEPVPSQSPREDAAHFVQDFRAEYGNQYPDFMICSYEEALVKARRDLKFLLVYVHSPGHQDTSWFCRDVLCSQEFCECLATNSILCFGVSVNSAEGVRVSYILRETTYPFLALIVLKRSRMIVCERVEGARPLAELVGLLRRSVADNEGELVVERTERLRREEDQRLRQAQDQAFEESLAADKEKQRKREEDLKRAEELVRQEEEEQRKEELKKEEFEMEKAVSLSRLPAEPNPNDPDTMQVMLRLPTGHRMERWFRTSDLLQSVYDFAYTDQSGQLPMKFTLVTNFPRKELVVESDGGPALTDLKLGKRCALFVQDDTA